MPLLSPKRQITIPKALCDRLHVQPGDELDIVEHDGRVTLIKKHKGASNGVLKHLKGDPRFTDEESLHGTVTSRRSSAKGKKRAA
jgi:AbrB family looped-hinge helix DNA binding protein